MRFLRFIENSHHYFCFYRTKMKFLEKYQFLVQIPYMSKFLLLSFIAKSSEPIKLQDSLISIICCVYILIILIFRILMDIQNRNYLIIHFWVRIVRHGQAQLLGNKAKGRISKRVFQENKARQIFWKTNISYPLIRTPFALLPKNFICTTFSEGSDEFSVARKSPKRKIKAFQFKDMILKIWFVYFRIIK